MKVRQIMQVLNAEIYYMGNKLESDCCTACGCDLMSDALAFSKSKMVLLTGLTNPQVIRTAEMLDVIAVVFVRGKKPAEEIIQLAEETDIAVLGTNYTLYEACGILYKHGLPGRIEGPK